MTAVCDWCARPAAELTPVEHERLCWSCTEAYLAEVAADAREAYYGAQYRYARPEMLPVTPRAYRYR